jgi:hypothetical protein
MKINVWIKSVLAVIVMFVFCMFFVLQDTNDADYTQSLGLEMGDYIQFGIFGLEPIIW